MINLQGICDALGGFWERLKSWGKSEFGSVKKQLKTLWNQLENIHANSIQLGLGKEEKDMMARISDFLSREEAMEKQRSRALWPTEGDRNTTFFQAKAKKDHALIKLNH